MLRHGNSQSLFDNGFYTQNSYVVAIVSSTPGYSQKLRKFYMGPWRDYTSQYILSSSTDSDVRLTMVTSTGDRDGLECNMGALIITDAFWGYNGPPNPILI